MKVNDLGLKIKFFSLVDDTGFCEIFTSSHEGIKIYCIFQILLGLMVQKIDHLPLTFSLVLFVEHA